MTIEELINLIAPYGILLAVIIAGYAAGFVVSRLLRMLFKRMKFQAVPVYVRHLRQPIRFLVTLIAVLFVSGSGLVGQNYSERVAHLLRVLLILDGTWIILGSLHVGEAYLKNRLKLDSEDNLSARKIFTQIGILRHIISFVVMLMSLGIVLSSFDGIRRLGTTLLASAGVVGLVLGVAAQKSIGLVLAGLQVALSQPIRIDDVLIVEGEWGKVEEIALTYVVVKIWDERRMVLPISYFIEKPFQNWTRTNSQLIGTVFVYADYSLPVDAMRMELDRVLPDIPEWDGRVKVVQVTEATQHGQELRILVSARNAPLLWDLRCIVREKMVEFLRRDYPGALVRFRAELSKAPNVAEDSTNTSSPTQQG